jgi:hypothetical protein
VGDPKPSRGSGQPRDDDTEPARPEAQRIKRAILRLLARARELRRAAKDFEANANELRGEERAQLLERATRFRRRADGVEAASKDPARAVAEAERIFANERALAEHLARQPLLSPDLFASDDDGRELERLHLEKLAREAEARAPIAPEPNGRGDGGALEITSKRARDKKGHPFRVVKLDGKVDEIPEGWVMALAEYRARGKASGKGQKDRLSRLRRWLRERGAHGDLAQLQVRGLPKTK